MVIVFCILYLDSTMTKNKKVYLVFMGPPGSGKGTQADILSEKINLPVLSPGELLRHEEEKKTKLGLAVEKIMKKGNLVSDDIIESLIDKRWCSGDTQAGIIFDGYPRNKKQLAELNRRLAEKAGALGIVRAILIKVSDKKVIERINGRRACDCGLIYHIKYNPPKKSGICDKDGAKLYIRDDDRLNIVKNRLKLYHSISKGLIKHWEKLGQLIEINGEQDIAKVEKDIETELKKIGIKSK